VEQWLVVCGSRSGRRQLEYLTEADDFSHESVDIGAILLRAGAAVALLVEVDR
jgi:hypothetical protein